MPASRPSQPSRPSRRRELQAFGQRVRDRRHQLGLSQEKLAERARLHPTYIGGIERGERNLSLANILKVAHALDVDPGELVRGL